MKKLSDSCLNLGAMLLLISFTFCVGTFSQITDSVPRYTPGGLLDKIFDNEGNIYNLDDLRVKDEHKNFSPPPSPPPATENLVVFPTCNSGYFELWFDDNSGLDSPTDPEHQARRNVICKVFEDVSNLIISPITMNNSETRVRILFRDYAQLAGTTGLGRSRTFYVAPQAPTNVGGIIDNECWKTIKSGLDSYVNLTLPLDLLQGGASSGTQLYFYHGIMALNFTVNTSALPNINWNTDLNTPTFDWWKYDLYATVLHEAMHILGFSSLIDFNGLSRFFPKNYYTRYDQHLMDNSQSNNLIINTSNCSSMYEYGPNPNLNPISSYLAPGCTNDPPVTSANQNSTDCVTAINYVGDFATPVYTPTCFEYGSSLSHFEDECVAAAPAGDEYYCMSNVGYNDVYFDNVNQVYYKRTLKLEERGVLCDIGYNTNSTFGNATNYNNMAYPSSCINTSIVGLNDGVEGTTYTYTVFENQSLDITGFLDNDVLIGLGNVTLSYQCVQDVYSPANTVINTVDPFTFSFQSSVIGLHLLRYVPITSDGIVGNITYIYVLVERDCSISASCNMVSNNGFEINEGNCGSIEYSPIPGAIVDCWNPVVYTPDLFVRNCSTNYGGAYSYSVPTNSFGNVDSWNESPNEAFLGLVSYPNDVYEAIATRLSMPLVNGQQYTIRLKARQSIHFQNPQASLGKITFAGSESLLPVILSPMTALPSGMEVLLPPIDITSPNWQSYEATFIYNGNPDLPFLNIVNSTNLNNVGEPDRQISYILIDDVELFEFNDLNVGVNISGPATSICPSQSVTFTATGTNGGTNPSYQWQINGVTVANETGATFTSSSLLNNDVVTCIFTNTDACVSSSSVTSNEITITIGGESVNLNITPDQSICSNQSIQLQVSGANSYVWSDDNSTSPSRTVSPDVTTTYTVTGTSNGCTGTASVTITVNAAPELSISPLNPTICGGQQITFTASGVGNNGDDYSWNHGLTSLGTGTTMTVTPPTPTSPFQGPYTIVVRTAPDANGCFGITQSVVTVIVPPVVTITPLNATICTGQSTNLTASGAVSYLWDNGLGASQTITVSPTATTSYTVTGTAGVCSVQSTATVTVESCLCTDFSQVNRVLNSALSNQTTFSDEIIIVSGTINISNNVTFKNCELRMQPGSEFVVNVGLTTFMGCHLYSCSDEMWNGIDVTQKGRVSLEPLMNGTTVVKTTLLEDAEIGIEAYAITQANFFLNVNNTTFNKNYIGIRIKDYFQNNPETYSRIFNSVFTCRNLPFTPATINNTGTFVWPATNSVKAATFQADVLNPPYIPEGLYSSTQNATLKFPHLGEKSFQGILLQGVGRILGTIDIGLTHQSMKVGDVPSGSNTSNQFNLFDNLHYGIYADNSNLYATNNVFQNILQLNKSVQGIAIYSTSDYVHSQLPNQLNKTELKAALQNGSANNRFYNCPFAVKIEDNWLVDIDRVDVRHHSTSTAVQRHGIVVTTPFFAQVSVTNSDFYNLWNAVQVNHMSTNPSITKNVNGNNYSLIGGGVNVFKNKFYDNYGNANVIGRAMRQAITVNAQNTANTLFSAISMPNTIVAINNNKIVDAYRGIQFSNWSRKHVEASNNEIKLVQESTISTVQFGISNANNQGISTNPNVIDNNIVDGYSADINDRLTAIYTSVSSSQRISCNYVSNTYHGIKFDGFNSRTRFELNNMLNHYYGYTLDNTGIIGTQGFINATSNYKTDNYWDGDWIAPRFKTATINSTAQDSKMYVRSSPATYNPNGSGTTINGTPFLTEYFQSGANSTLLSSNTNNALSCTTDHGNPNSGGGNGGGNGNGGNNGIITGNAEIQLLEQIARGEMLYTHNPEQTKIINEHKLFQLLKQQPELRQNSQDLELFYQDNLNTNKGKVSNAEELLESGNISMASNEIANIVDDNEVDFIYKAYYDWYLDQTWDSLPNPEDSVKLFEIANLCPFTSGIVVYQARALYQALYFYSEAFADNCVDNRDGSSARKMQNYEAVDVNDQVNRNELNLLFYPNPTDGTVYFSKFGMERIPYDIKVFDLTGKLIYEKEVVLEDSEQKLSLTVSNGIYNIEVTNKNSSEKTNFKLHIIH